MDMTAALRIRIIAREMLYKGFVNLEKVTLRHPTLGGGTQTVDREIHDHGNAATILLYDPVRRTVIMVRQLRVPAFLNGGEGWLIETPAGLLDGDAPADAIAREAMEETGFLVENPQHLFDAYMSPGAVTERVSFFAAEIDVTRKTGAGGGLADEGEDIEVLEIPFTEAYAMIASGEICDAKTIMLLQWARMQYGF